MSRARKKGEVVGVCMSHHRRAPKKNIDQGMLKQGVGLEGDSHAGTERQISLLASNCQLYGSKGYSQGFESNVASYT